MTIDENLQPSDLSPALRRFWSLSGEKILRIERDYDRAQGSPVFTAAGSYTSRGWTEWTEGFAIGAAILQFDATGDTEFLDLGRRATVERMAPHVSHFGVHDHGFNNLSTYGNLLRLMNEGRIPDDNADGWQRNFHELALKLSAASQARRWTPIAGGGGFIYSFNGPHSLFVDTIRSCRSLAVGALLGHRALDEGDREFPLLGRCLEHALATARFSVFYGNGRDRYDTRGRTAHECLFNVNDGQFRCPSSQQGFSAFTTWTRGLAWAMLGFAELLELLPLLDDSEFAAVGGRAAVEEAFLDAARATCDFYLAQSAADGIPYWDTGAPDLGRLGDDYLARPADPWNDWEPVDSSAAAIAAQGLLRLGRSLGDGGRDYLKAGLTVARTLFDEPYLSVDPGHQGLILHSIYHRPNGWDHVPDGARSPHGEASMWGDYHARELAVYLGRIADGAPYHAFFHCVRGLAR